MELDPRKLLADVVRWWRWMDGATAEEIEAMEKRLEAGEEIEPPTTPELEAEIRAWEAREEA